MMITFAYWSNYYSALTRVPGNKYFYNLKLRFNRIFLALLIFLIKMVTSTFLNLCLYEKRYKKALFYKILPRYYCTLYTS